MAKPGILTVDDDVNVLRAVRNDLRKKYGSEYRISSADSGQQALELLTELKKRGDATALMVVDQRMPNMSGVEFLTEAIQLFPESKRVLLTAYADTNAAIAAINQVQIDHWKLLRAKRRSPPKALHLVVLIAQLPDLSMNSPFHESRHSDRLTETI